MADLISMIEGENNLYTEMMKENLDKRVLVLNEEIDDCVIENYILYILKWNAEDKHLAAENRTPITIYISTPGGSVFDADTMIDVIQASKTPVKVVGLSLVASAGFHIFISGHERIAFKNSILLCHDGSVSVSNTAKKAKETMKFFDQLDERVKNHVVTHTNITPEKYDDIYDTEFYMFADEAKELGCVDKIIGIDCDLDYIL